MTQCKILKYCVKDFENLTNYSPGGGGGEGEPVSTVFNTAVAQLVSWVFRILYGFSSRIVPKNLSILFAHLRKNQELHISTLIYGVLTKATEEKMVQISRYKYLFVRYEKLVFQHGKITRTKVVWTFYGSHNCCYCVLLLMTGNRTISGLWWATIRSLLRPSIPLPPLPYPHHRACSNAVHAVLASFSVLRFPKSSNLQCVQLMLSSSFPKSHKCHYSWCYWVDRSAFSWKLSGTKARTISKMGTCRISDDLKKLSENWFSGWWGRTSVLLLSLLEKFDLSITWTLM